MAFVPISRVLETGSGSGTGNVTLLGAQGSGEFDAFNERLSVSDSTFYVIVDGAQFEIGYGTYSSATPDNGTFTRDTVIRSSGGTSKISLSGSNFNIFGDIPPEKALVVGADGSVTNVSAVAASVIPKDLASMKALQEPDDNTIIGLGYNTTEGDGLGGLFRWDDTSTATADDIHVIQLNAVGSSPGRFIRERQFLFLGEAGSDPTVDDTIMRRSDTHDIKSRRTDTGVKIIPEVQTVARHASYATLPALKAVASSNWKQGDLIELRGISAEGDTSVKVGTWQASSTNTDSLDVTFVRPDDISGSNPGRVQFPFDINVEGVLGSDLASLANGKGASLIGVEDSGSLYTATTVEAALVEARKNAFIDGGTIAADVNNEITVAPRRRYTLTASDTIAGVIGLADGEFAQLIAPVSGSTTLQDEGTATSGQSLKLSGADLVIQSTDETVYTITRAGANIRVSGGGALLDAVLSIPASGVGGTGDAITLTKAGGPALADGLTLSLIPGAANTGAVTVNYNAGGALALVDSLDAALTADALKTTAPVVIRYTSSGTKWRLIAGSAGSAEAADLNADYVRLSDTLTLDGSTNQYTAFKALIETAHTKKKVIIFDGQLAVDFSPGAITPGGPQEWVVEKGDYTQGLWVTGVVITSDLLSCKLTSPLELSKAFAIDASAVPNTNRTVLPNGTTLFGIGASDIILRGKLTGTLNASLTAATGTGLSLAKAISTTNFNDFTIERARIADWWRVYFSDNADTGTRDNFYFRDLNISNIGNDPIVVNAPGATGQNTDVLFENVQLNNFNMDIDGSVGLGAAACRRITCTNIGLSGYGSVAFSCEEMDYAQYSNIQGEIDHSRHATGTQALFHIKANNVSTGSYIANESVKINDVHVKQVGDLTGIANSHGIQFTGNSGSSTSAVNDFEGNNISLEGFARGVWDVNEDDAYSPLRFNRLKIDAGGITGAGVYGVYANQISLEWSDITIIGCEVGARMNRSSEIYGWTFKDCLDTITGADAGGTIASGCNFIYTAQTVPGSSSLVIKFLPVSIASTLSAIWAKFTCTAKSVSTNVISTAVYEIARTNSGGITGTWPAGATTASTSHALNATFSDTEVESALNSLGSAINERGNPSGDTAYTIGDSDQLITWRGGVGGTVLTLGPADEAASRGVHFADTNETSVETDGCLALKIEKPAAGDVTDLVIIIQMSNGSALLAANARINDYPA